MRDFVMHFWWCTFVMHFAKLWIASVQVSNSGVYQINSLLMFLMTWHKTRPLLSFCGGCPIFRFCDGFPMFRFLWSNRMSEFPSQRLLLTRNDNKKLGEICTTYWCIACVAVAFLIRHSTVCWVRMRIKFSSRTDDVVVQGEVSCVSSGEVSQFFKGSTWQSEHVYDFFFAAFCREKRSPQSLLNKARYLNFCSRKRSEGNISASLRTYWELRSHVSSFQPLLFHAVNPRGILFVNVCTSCKIAFCKCAHGFSSSEEIL